MKLTLIQKFICSCIRSTGTHELGFPVGLTSQFLMIMLLLEYISNNTGIVVVNFAPERFRPNVREIVDEVEEFVGVFGASTTAVHESKHLQHPDDAAGVSSFDRVSELTQDQRVTKQETHVFKHHVSLLAGFGSGCLQVGWA